MLPWLIWQKKNITKCSTLKRMQNAMSILTVKISNYTQFVKLLWKIPKRLENFSSNDPVLGLSVLCIQRIVSWWLCSVHCAYWRCHTQSRTHSHTWTWTGHRHRPTQQPHSFWCVTHIYEHWIVHVYINSIPWRWKGANTATKPNVSMEYYLLLLSTNEQDRYRRNERRVRAAPNSSRQR